MEKLKKEEAFARAQAAFGPWREWGRRQHVAYGLIRGVPYVAMERCSNDNPPTYGIALAHLGAWPELKPVKDKPLIVPEAQRQEVKALVVWVHKKPRGKRMRPSRGAPPTAAE